MKIKICPTCGMLNSAAINEQLWDVYDRISDGRSRWEPLVYSAEEYEDSYDPEFDDYSANLAMERDMVRRGLCPTCSRPDLRGVTDDMIVDDEDYQEMSDMWAEEAAERRAGC